jgi:acetyl-CoA C-acetyltransferase
MGSDPRGLCIIGVAQQTTRSAPASEPLDSWVQVAQAAAADARAPSALAALDSVQIVYCQSWQYDDAVARLAKRLGADPRHRVYSGVGGTTPQLLVSVTAEAMRRGELDLALVVSAEALATKRVAKRSGEKLAWSYPEKERSPFPWERPHATERNHSVFQAWETFPLWDTARRAARNIGLDDYARQTAEMMSRLTGVAAQNPYAWRRQTLSATEIATVTPDNRYVGWPYTKHEVAVMDVDMAAALLLATSEKADALGVPADRRVYLSSSSYAEDAASIAARPNLSASPGMAIAGRGALAAAGLGIDDLSLLDLYSCFPSSLHLCCDALDVSTTDSRGLTVTGGLPYAGGPASAYLLHAIASVVEGLRKAPGAALVTGVGMNLQKHIAAVYSSTPGWASAPTAASPSSLPLVTTFTGEALVRAYTIAHGRDGHPVEGLVVLDTKQGRTLARIRRADLLVDAKSCELVGRGVTVITDGLANEAVW